MLESVSRVLVLLSSSADTMSMSLPWGSGLNTSIYCHNILHVLSWLQVLLRIYIKKMFLINILPKNPSYFLLNYFFFFCISTCLYISFVLASDWRWCRDTLGRLAESHVPKSNSGLLRVQTNLQTKLVTSIFILIVIYCYNCNNDDVDGSLPSMYTHPQPPSG